MGWLLFFLLEQNSSCSEPVAKEWCVWHGHHSAFNGYGERSHELSSCFARSVHFSSSLRCVCSCLDKCTQCVCQSIVVLGPIVSCAAFRNYHKPAFARLLYLYSSQPTWNAIDRPQCSWACCISATEFWRFSCCGPVVSVTSWPRGKSLAGLPDF